MTGGKAQIARAFELADQRSLAAIMPYFTLGYPDRDQCLDVLEAIAPHSDLLELGIPFSDPLADGPTIQHSTQQALEKGVTVQACLDMLSELRDRGVDTPCLFMSYFNPLLAYGVEAFVNAAAVAGAQGLIVPDLPPEEAGAVVSACAAAGLAYVYFLAPTSDPQRIASVVEKASGFIYLVSVTGVTGARDALAAELAPFVASVREALAAAGRGPVPLAVGFGISTPQQAAAIGRLADGVIVGSALINAVDEADDEPAAAAAFVRSLKAGVAR